MADVIRILNLSKSTVRSYCRDYGAHMSSGATPPLGGTRSFVESDFRLMAYIREQTRNGISKKDVLVSLPNGLRGFEWTMPQGELSAQDLETQVVPQSTLNSWEAAVARQDRQIEKLENDNDELSAENKKLLIENGELRGENRILKQERKGFWGRLFGG